MVRLVLLMIAGGVLTWACGHGVEYVLGDNIVTSLQFRFYLGITIAFALGGGAHLKDPKVSFTPNHNYYIALFAIPGLLFAAPLFSLPAEWQGLSIVAVMWGVLAGGGGYLLSKMLNFSNS